MVSIFEGIPEIPKWLMDYGKPLLSAGFLIGLCSFALKKIDKRLTKDQKTAFDQWLCGKTRLIDGATPESVYAWLRERNFALMIWPAAFLVLLLIYLEPWSMWPHRLFVVDKVDYAPVGAPLLILGGALAAQKTIKFAFNLLPNIGEGLAVLSRIVIWGTGTAVVLGSLHFLFDHFDPGDGTPTVAHVGSILTGLPMVALAGTLIWLAAILLLFLMMWLLHYPMRVCARVLMQWATSPKGAWGALFYFLTGCMGVVRVLVELL